MHRILVLTFIGLTSSIAQAFVIDFDELQPGGVQYEPITSGVLGTKQFVFTGIGDYYDGGILALGSPAPAGYDSTALYYCPECAMEMAHSEGDLFTLFSLDYFGAGSADVIVTGMVTGGSTVQTTLSYSSGVMSTHVFGTEWTNLEKVVFGVATATDGYTFGTGIDNLVVAPIPAAAWLFASGLGLLGWLRRRQTA